MLEWFHIRDKRPANSEEYVLIYSRSSITVDKRGDYMVARYIKEGGWNNEPKWQTITGTIDIGWYPYWTPLPVPPEMTEEERVKLHEEKLGRSLNYTDYTR